MKASEAALVDASEHGRACSDEHGRGVSTSASRAVAQGRERVHVSTSTPSRSVCWPHHAARGGVVAVPRGGVGTRCIPACMLTGAVVASDRLEASVFDHCRCDVRNNPGGRRPLWGDAHCNYGQFKLGLTKIRSKQVNTFHLRIVR